jgi:hypothetical protein
MREKTGVAYIFDLSEASTLNAMLLFKETKRD